MHVPNRREALKGLVALGTAGLGAGLWPIRPARAEDLIVGFVYIGPREDWGWNQSFATVASALTGMPDVRVVEAGYLPESTDYSSGQADTQTLAYAEALEGLIADGAGLVVSTAFGHDPFLLAAANKHPNVAFRQATASAVSSFPRNVGSQNALIDQGHYVNGVAAGLCTASNKLGFVAGRPLGVVLLNINSFMLGARQTNPAATVQVAFAGGWEDAKKDAAATNALVDAGCDVITCHLDSPKVVIATAENRGVKSCGHAFNQAPLAPQGYITGAEFHWSDMIETFVERLQKGAPLPNFATGGYDKGYVRSSPFGAGATSEAINAATAAIQAMKDNHPLFVGPIKDNAGKVVVPAGTTYGPYAPELAKTDYLIDGVIGSIPD